MPNGDTKIAMRKRKIVDTPPIYSQPKFVMSELDTFA